MILSVLNGIIFKLLRVSLRHDPFLNLLNCTICEKVTFKLSNIYATTIAYLQKWDLPCFANVLP